MFSGGAFEEFVASMARLEERHDQESGEVIRPESTCPYGSVSPAPSA
jgi:hypothetical protein